MDPRLHTYLQHLLETAHKTSTIPQPLADKMVADLHIQLEQRLTAALIDRLSPADQQAYVSLLEHGGAQADVTAFLNSHIVGADAIVQQTRQQFEVDYIHTVNRSAHADQ